MLEQPLLNLTHEQQQEAVEKIQSLMRQGISCGEAIARVADELRKEENKEKVR